MTGCSRFQFVNNLFFGYIFQVAVALKTAGEGRYEILKIKLPGQFMELGKRIG